MIIHSPNKVLNHQLNRRNQNRKKSHPFKKKNHQPTRHLMKLLKVSNNRLHKKNQKLKNQSPNQRFQPKKKLRSKKMLLTTTTHKKVVKRLLQKVKATVKKTWTSRNLMHLQKVRRQKMKTFHSRTLHNDKLAN